LGKFIYNGPQLLTDPKSVMITQRPHSLHEKRSDAKEGNIVDASELVGCILPLLFRTRKGES
jgi:hypothetical protein